MITVSNLAIQFGKRVLYNDVNTPAALVVSERPTRYNSTSEKA